MGGSSGGGGSSGEVDFPCYMKTQHETWLTAVASDMTTAKTGGSPFATAVAYDPTAIFADIDAQLTLLKSGTVALAPSTDWAAGVTAFNTANTETAPTATVTDPTAVLIPKADVGDISPVVTPVVPSTTAVSPTVSPYTGTVTAPTIATVSPTVSIAVPTHTVGEVDTDLLSDLYIAGRVTAYTDERNADYTNRILPAFRRGLQDVGAVMSSSFSVGEALLQSEVTRNIATFSSELYLRKEELRVRLEELKQRNETTKVQNADLTMRGETLKLEEVNVKIAVEQLKLAEVQQELALEGLKLQNTQLGNTRIGLINQAAQITNEGEKLSLLENEISLKLEALKLQALQLTLDAQISKLRTVDQALAKDGANLQASEVAIRLEAVKAQHSQSYASLRSNTGDSIMRGTMSKVGAQKDVVHYTTESGRIKTVISGEEQRLNLDYDVKDALWDLEVYQYGNNVLASISGAPTSRDMDTGGAKSMVGGALSGAAIGAQVGGPWGAAAGGVIGGIGGLLS